jgi:hypothetical protein
MVVVALSVSPVQAARITIREMRPPVRRWGSVALLRVMRPGEGIPPAGVGTPNPTATGEVVRPC